MSHSLGLPWYIPNFLPPVPSVIYPLKWGWMDGETKTQNEEMNNKAVLTLCRGPGTQHRRGLQLWCWPFASPRWNKYKVKRSMVRRSRVMVKWKVSVRWQATLTKQMIKSINMGNLVSLWHRITVSVCLAKPPLELGHWDHRKLWDVQCNYLCMPHSHINFVGKGLGHILVAEIP